MGLNEGEYSVEAFEYADEHPAGFHPLNESRLSLLRVEETAFVLGSGPDQAWLVDDEQHALARSPIAQPFDSSVTPVVALSGNLDDDAHAELVMVGHAPDHLSVVVKNNDGNAILSRTSTLNVPISGVAPGAVRAVLGDFDGDDKAELALAACGGNGPSWVRLYDFGPTGFTFVKDIQNVATGRADVDLAAGNFDADAAAELAILHMSHQPNSVDLVVLDDSAHEFAVLKDWENQSLLPGNLGPDHTEWRGGGIVRAGNVDTDDQDELYVLLALDSGSFESRSWLFDDVTGSSAVLATPGSAKLQYPVGELARPFDAVFADLNGDETDELYILSLTPESGYFDWTITQWTPASELPATDPQGGNKNETPAGLPPWSKLPVYLPLDPGYQPNSMVRLAVVDGDHLLGETLVVALKDAGMEHPLTTLRIGAEARTWMDDEHQSYRLQIPTPVRSSELYAPWVPPLVAGGDFDNDSFQVRYTGENWLSLPSPRPLVVVAAPPLRDGITQNYDFSGTVFGKQVERSASTGNEISATYSTTFSFETGALTDLVSAFPIPASAGFWNALERAFAQSQTNTQIESYGISYTTAYPDDTIIFEGVLYHSYAYEIVSASDPGVVGDLMTIDVPVALKTYKWTIDYYNSKLGPDVPKIGPETFEHKPGDPASYPSTTKRDYLLGRYTGWKSPQVPVGQGSGVSEANISLEFETKSASSTTITESSGWGIASAGLGYDSSMGYAGANIYEISIGNLTSYQGIVGDIADHDEYRDYHYDFGLFVYNFIHPAGPRYQVIDYWTSNFGPGYD